MRTVTRVPGNSCLFSFAVVRRGPDWIQRPGAVLPSSCSLVTCGSVERRGRGLGSPFSVSQHSHLDNGGVGWPGCRSAQAGTFLPPLTYQLSLLSSGQGEPLPLPAALCHLRRVCRRRRPVVHAQRHQLPSTPDTLPLQRKASSSRAGARGPSWKPQGGGVEG